MPSIRLPATDEPFERYKERLATFIRRRVPDKFDAEDILQDSSRSFLGRAIQLTRSSRSARGCFAWLAIASLMFFAKKGRSDSPI